MRQFSFIFPLTEAVKDNTRREGLRYYHAGDWIVTGTYSRKLKVEDSRNLPLSYTYKIQEIVNTGTDTSPILEKEDVFNKVRAACINHIEGLLTNDDTQKNIPSHHKIGSLVGQVIPIQRSLRKVR